MGGVNAVGDEPVKELGERSRLDYPTTRRKAVAIQGRRLLCFQKGAAVDGGVRLRSSNAVIVGPGCHGRHAVFVRP